ncbi:MAG: GAF domain-containing protein [Candidatus Competibacteraceae bacterium]|nr:GAF domain-containing protein [Candidatus Competibacteraceae bacterium]MCP5124832.1 GAF domain-containing protein [Gammaproteobacteria bacterium]
MQLSNSSNLLQRLEHLNRIGIALSKERDTLKLLDIILIAAKRLLNADGGTLYRLVEEQGRQQLRFDVVYNDSLHIHIGGATGTDFPDGFPRFIPLHDASGQPNTGMVVTYAVLNNTTVVIDDAYVEQSFDFSGTHRFDQHTGYRSRSFLTVPMKNHEEEIIGVFQLINALDPKTGQVRTFSPADRQLAESLASQAAIALTNRQLIKQLENLFEALIALINTAIDHKSPYTGGHCQRVPILTMMIAEAAQRSKRGRLKDFCPTPEELYELKIAGLLHDCGKITTPVHVVDKATKLETLFDRIHLVDTRFEVLKRDAEIEMLKGKLTALESGDLTTISCLEQQFSEKLTQLEEERAYVRHNNIGGEFMSAADQERIRQIAARRWVGPDGQDSAFLSEDEVHNLCIARGTLNPAERAIIEEHVALTMRMLNQLPWPKNLRNVAEYAGSHHEKLDGHGYHRGLNESSLPLPSRIICLADVFEALTARDRPYKPGKKMSEVLTILGRMVQDHEIDSDLFDAFVREGVWLDYARQWVQPEQMDAIDISQIPGYTP